MILKMKKLKAIDGQLISSKIKLQLQIKKVKFYIYAKNIRPII